MSAFPTSRKPARSGRACASAWSYQKSFSRRLTASVILPMKAAFAHQGLRQPHPTIQACDDQRIAPVFEVEFEPLGRIYGRAPRSPAIPSRERQCGVFEQENSADLPVDVAGNPEAFHVAADEKCRDRLVDDAGIERPKLRGDGCGRIGRQDARDVRRPARSQPWKRPAPVAAKVSGHVSCMAVIARFSTGDGVPGAAAGERARPPPRPVASGR